MASIANKEIREAAKKAGLRLWQVADGVGLSESYFSRKLRKELPDDERRQVLDVIAQLATENGRAS